MNFYQVQEQCKGKEGGHGYDDQWSKLLRKIDRITGGGGGRTMMDQRVGVPNVHPIAYNLGGGEKKQMAVGL